MKRQDFQIDKLIKNTLMEEAKRIHVPSEKVVWKQILLKQNKKTFNINNLRLIAYAFSTVIVSLLLIFAYSSINDLHMNFFKQSFIQVQPEEQIAADNQKQKIFTNIEEARKEVPFNFRIPSFIPDGYILHNLTLKNFGNNYGELVISYKSKNKEFMLIENNLTGDMVNFSSVRVPDSIEEAININGQKGKIISFNDGSNQFEYGMNDLNFTIHGYFSREEIIKIVQSF